MADPMWLMFLISFLRNKSLHDDITAIAKDYLCVSQLLDLIRHLSI